MKLRMPPLSVEARELNRIAGIIENTPGPEGAGMRAPARAAVFAYLTAPTPETWHDARRALITRHHTVWVAGMRHLRLGLHERPTPGQLLDLLHAAANGEL